MKLIPISGIIANYEMENESNVTPASLRKSLKDANGEDILVTINSPGGSIFAGLEMFSMLKNYPGNVETRIVSLAASMGSVLALAGDKKSVENTALYFVHNAQGYGVGDYRDLLKESEWLKDVSNLIASLYEEYTSLSFDEAMELMDADTSFFGQDLELLGFNIVKADSNTTEPQAKINARLKFQEAAEKIKSEKFDNGLEKVAASIDYSKFGLNKENKTVTKFLLPQTKAQNPAVNSAGKNNNTPEVKSMTLNELLSQNPAAKQEHEDKLKAQFEAGAESMKERMTSAGKYLAPDSVYPSAIKNIAVDVLNCKKSVEALETTVSAFDALKQSQESAAAKTETAALGETPAEITAQKSADGILMSEADIVSEANRLRGIN